MHVSAHTCSKESPGLVAVSCLMLFTIGFHTLLVLRQIINIYIILFKCFFVRNKSPKSLLTLGHASDMIPLPGETINSWGVGDPRFTTGNYSCFIVLWKHGCRLDLSALWISQGIPGQTRGIPPDLPIIQPRVPP